MISVIRMISVPFLCIQIESDFNMFQDSEASDAPVPHWSKLIKTFSTQQNSENRDKIFQKLCSDIDRFGPNAVWT